ncbi:hypothetical protein NEOLEDRAFT_1167972 [Neolentinus lepideus HHB14362 ss-1]|uniref:Uncharacterized protein n=1 Tax=Neolentinus lepideus HHB14362 ss-1 TaxID=1314782 RepID=A0A165UBV4_9AGAM|nr:hypothetical protein NEOLEDRAFT_1167972 [Neolentinus lepideus HHB14362 ss-1]
MCRIVGAPEIEQQNALTAPLARNAKCSVDLKRVQGELGDWMSVLSAKRASVTFQSGLDKQRTPQATHASLPPSSSLQLRMQFQFVAVWKSHHHQVYRTDVSAHLRREGRQCLLLPEVTFPASAIWGCDCYGSARFDIPCERGDGEKISDSSDRFKSLDKVNFENPACLNSRTTHLSDVFNFRTRVNPAGVKAAVRRTQSFCDYRVVNKRRCYLQSTGSIGQVDFYWLIALSRYTSVNVVPLVGLMRRTTTSASRKSRSFRALETGSPIARTQSRGCGPLRRRNQSYKSNQTDVVILRLPTCALHRGRSEVGTRRGYLKRTVGRRKAKTCSGEMDNKNNGPIVASRHHLIEHEQILSANSASPGSQVRGTSNCMTDCEKGGGNASDVQEWTITSRAVKDDNQDQPRPLRMNSSCFGTQLGDEVIDPGSYEGPTATEDRMVKTCETRQPDAVQSTVVAGRHLPKEWQHETKASYARYLRGLDTAETVSYELSIDPKSVLRGISKHQQTVHTHAGRQ